GWWAGIVVVNGADAWVDSVLVRPPNAVTYLHTQAKNAVRVVSGDVSANRHAVDTLHEQIARAADLPAIHGTVDAFPDLAGVPVSLPGVSYHPRPMFLSINSQTRRLIKANARFYAGP